MMETAAKPRPSPRIPLEAEVQAELHLAHIGLSGSDLPGPDRVYIIGGLAQVHVVDGVKVFPGELQRLALRDGEGLAQRKVEQSLARPAHGVMAHVAIASNALGRDEGR